MSAVETVVGSQASELSADMETLKAHEEGAEVVDVGEEPGDEPDEVKEAKPERMPVIDERGYLVIEMADGTIVQPKNVTLPMSWTWDTFDMQEVEKKLLAFKNKTADKNADNKGAIEAIEATAGTGAITECAGATDKKRKREIGVLPRGRELLELLGVEEDDEDERARLEYLFYEVRKQWKKQFYPPVVRAKNAKRPEVPFSEFKAGIHAQAAEWVASELSAEGNKRQKNKPVNCLRIACENAKRLRKKHDEIVAARHAATEAYKAKLAKAAEERPERIRVKRVNEAQKVINAYENSDEFKKKQQEKQLHVQKTIADLVVQFVEEDKMPLSDALAKAQESVCEL